MDNLWESKHFQLTRQAKISPSNGLSTPSVLELSWSKPAQHHYHPTVTTIGAHFYHRSLCSLIVCKESRQTV
ncbi:hypothetical protein QQF64_020632 [Cirrhinus molitorella]|uniref:Uncharacterized protein n=1 Tax=Cirrhinus molitorella TaxID=172907 RepID=A0ABR3LD75_9TELE